MTMPIWVCPRILGYASHTLRENQRICIKLYYWFEERGKPDLLKPLPSHAHWSPASHHLRVAGRPDAQAALSGPDSSISEGHLPSGNRTYQWILASFQSENQCT